MLLLQKNLAKLLDLQNAIRMATNKLKVLYFKYIEKCQGLKIERKTFKTWSKDNKHVQKQLCKMVAKPHPSLSRLWSFINQKWSQPHPACTYAFRKKTSSAKVKKAWSRSQLCWHGPLRIESVTNVSLILFSKHDKLSLYSLWSTNILN